MCLIYTYVAASFSSYFAGRIPTFMIRPLVCDLKKTRYNEHYTESAIYLNRGYAINQKRMSQLGEDVR